MIQLPIRIGTRGSPMALAQAHIVQSRLQAAHDDLADPAAVQIVVINTIADRVLDRPLATIGGKGLFTKELEQALLDRRIDLAVHSMKDVETWLPEGLEIACILPRDDPRDAFVCMNFEALAALPPGASIGTSSLRRQAQVLRLRPDLRVVPLRGNANTRLRKLAEGACDATFLALCGLQRLGLEAEAKSVMSPDEILPAVAQGALGIECRLSDELLREWLKPIHCPISWAAVSAERSLLAALDGSCRTPVAALAQISGDKLSLRALLATMDGKASWSAAAEGPITDAVRLGRAAGNELKERAGPQVWSSLH